MTFSLKSFFKDGNRNDNFQIGVLKKCVLYTLIWGLAAHAYGFLNFTISHDSLEALYSGSAESVWKISIGRVFVPIYRLLTRGMLTTPWMIGILSLVWIGISVYLVVRIFEIRSDCMIVLTAGILTVNPAVIALTATYLHDFDIDMFALMLAAMSVYLWKRFRRGIYAGMIFIACTLGLYQSYLSVAIVLIMIVSMMNLLEGDTWKSVVCQGIKGVFMLLGGGILYLVMLKLICLIGQVPLSDSYNSISQLWNVSGSWIYNIVRAYYYWAADIFNPATLYPDTVMVLANVLIGICIAGIGLSVIFGKKLGNTEKLLFIILGCLLPLGMNISCVFSGGMAHGLMMYAYCLIYLLALLLGEWEIHNAADNKKRMAKWIRAITLVIIGFTLWNYFPVANAAYLKKDLERQQTMSLMTRVVAEMESREDYVRGETQVAFIGKINMREMPGFETFDGNGRTTGIIGLTENDQIKNYRDYEAYFTYILNNPANLCGEEQCVQLAELDAVKKMPVFPEKGSMEVVDGILIVKMGTND